jgi:hypothetical protein
MRRCIERRAPAVAATTIAVALSTEEPAAKDINKRTFHVTRRARMRRSSAVRNFLNSYSGEIQRNAEDIQQQPARWFR